MLQYTECGLDNIWLLNGYEVIETPYGEATMIENERALHDAIAESLFCQSGVLTGKEFLFLRKEMDMSQKAIADVFGVTDGTVRNLERKEKLDAAYSHLMKALSQEYFTGSSRILEIIEAAKDKHDRKDSRISFEEDENGWHQKAA
ncbi:MAG: transcriptional regulator [Thiomicrospira sp.]|nr:MAG: transcriptional regulator [Thiomicrospira sp.]